MPMGTYLLGRNKSGTYTDPSGLFVVVDDVIILAILGVIVLGSGVLLTPEGQTMINDGAKALQKLLTETFDSFTLSSPGELIIPPPKIEKSTTFETDIAILNSMAETRKLIRKYGQISKYWIANYVPFGRDSKGESLGTYVPGQEIAYTKAIFYVRDGGSVFASNQASAHRLALAVRLGRPSRIINNQI